MPNVYEYDKTDRLKPSIFSNLHFVTCFNGFNSTETGLNTFIFLGT